jgi:hypothetical protein
MAIIFPETERFPAAGIYPALVWPTQTAYSLCHERSGSGSDAGAGKGAGDGTGNGIVATLRAPRPRLLAHHVHARARHRPGPGTSPGSGITVLRATDHAEAQSIAERDPFVLAGLRTFATYQWRLNEGSVGIQISLGQGTYHWQ